MCQARLKCGDVWQLQAGEEKSQPEKRRLSARPAAVRGGAGLGPVLSCPGSVLQVKDSKDQEGQIRGSRRSGGNLAMDWSSKPSTHLRSSHLNSVVTLPRKPRWEVLFADWSSWSYIYRASGGAGPRQTVAVETYNNSGYELNSRYRSGLCSWI